MKDHQKRVHFQSKLNAELSDLSVSSLQREYMYQIATGGETMNKKMLAFSPTRFVVVIALVVLALATTAFALTRPAVLDWLLGNDQPSPQLEATAQTVIAENTIDEITVRINSVVYDGEQLAFSYELENEHPTMPVLIANHSTALVDGQQMNVFGTNDPSNPHMVPSPHLDVLPVRRNPAVGGGFISVGDVAKGKVSCEMTFSVYSPEKQFAVLLTPDSMQGNPEAYSGSTREEVEDSLNTLKGFQNAIFIDEAQLSDEQWLSEGYTVILPDGMLYDLPETSHLKEVSQIKITFDFDASVAFSCDFSNTEDVALEDCTLHVERFRLSSLETGFDLWLIPQENTEEAAQQLADKYGSYELTDGQGTPVQYSVMDYTSTPEPSVQQLHGQWVCRYSCTMPGLQQFPESVGVTAGGCELIRFDLMIEE